MPFIHPQMGLSKLVVGFQNRQLKIFGKWMLLNDQFCFGLIVSHSIFNYELQINK
jgi:hypothetical protein